MNSLTTQLDLWVGRVTAGVVLLAVALMSYGVTLSTDPVPLVPQAISPLYRQIKHPVAPVRLVVPSERIHAAVVPIALSSDLVLEPPADYTEVGWWDTSAKIGAHQGQTVITGHTVHTGGGSMNNIGKVKPGQVVEVITPRGTMHYRVQTVHIISKDKVAKQAQQLFGQQHGNGRLVLITCINWNGTDYPDNVIVTAKPLGVPLAKSQAPHTATAGAPLR